MIYVDDKNLIKVMNIKYFYCLRPKRGLVLTL